MLSHDEMEVPKRNGLECAVQAKRANLGPKGAIKWPYRVSELISRPKW